MSWDAPTPPPTSALLVGVVVSALLLLLVDGAAVVQSSPQLLLLQQQLRSAEARPNHQHHHRRAGGNSSIEERMLRIEEIKNHIRASFGAIRLPPSAAAAAERAAAGVKEEDRRRIRAELRLRETLAGGGEGRGGGGSDDAEDASSLDLYSFRQLQDAGQDGDDGDVGASNRFRFAVNIPQGSDEATGRRRRIESAMLHLYKEAVRPYNLNDSLNVAANVAVSVHQLLPGGRRRLIGARVVSLAERGWISFDVSEAVQSWLDDPLANRGLLVDAPPPHNLSALLDFASGGGADDDPSAWAAYSRAPLLDVRVYQQQRQLLHEKSPSPSRTRTRRDSDPGGDVAAPQLQQQSKRPSGSSPRRSGSAERCAPGQCCRKRLTISFADDLGWTWVVEPKTFDAYYCEGGCVGDYKAANSFAEVKKALRRSSSPGLRNRCTPTRYKPLTVVHVDKYGDYIMTQNRDMIVDECGCA